MSEEEHDLVEVPENAIRDDPLAFGLTAPQLGLAGAAAAVAFVLNLLPIWVPLRLGLAILVAAPIFGVAVLSIRGEPGYRWLLRFVRFARSERRWFVPTPATADSATATSGQSTPTVPNTDDSIALSVPEDAPDTDTAALPPERSPMSDKPVRLRLVAGDTDEPSGSDERPPELQLPDTPALPHLLRGLRLVCFLSFAGGVGKTTLAVETASLVGTIGRYVAGDGSEAPVRVLLLDAARFAPAAAIRLGVPPEGRISVRGALRPQPLKLRGSDPRLALVETKTAASRRTLAAPGFVLEALRQHQARSAEVPANVMNLVFTTPRGTPIDPRNANRQFGEFLRRNELPHIRVHDLRHTAASLLLAQGLTLEDVKRYLGHSSIVQTSNTYGHLVAGRSAEVAAGMDRAVLG